MEKFDGIRRRCKSCKHYQRYYIMYEVDFFPTGNGFCQKQSAFWNNVEVQDDTTACEKWEMVEIPDNLRKINKCLRSILKQTNFVYEMIRSGSGAKKSDGKKEK